MKRVICGAVLALVAWTGTLVAGGADFSLTGKNTTITFIGSKPDGKHDGGFKDVTGTASVQGKDLTTLKLSVEINMDSLYSDTPKLTTHLKSPDFFSVKSNPKSKFVSTKVEKSGDEYKITGDLTMCGTTKALTFPAQIKLDGTALTVSGKFSIDKSQWGMTYGKGKINEEVKLTVSVNAQK